MVKLQGLVLLQPLPAQLVKREPLAALAVIFTTLPTVTGMEQSALQVVVPRGVVMLTAPNPVPAFVKVNRPILPSAAAMSIRRVTIFRWRAGPRSSVTSLPLD